jgi:hypothetical protein
MTEAKTLALTIVVVGLLLLYLYWQNRVHPAGWMPDDAQEQLRRERRVPPRIKCATQVSISANRRSVEGVTVNVAIGGILLTPSAPLSVGEPVHVSMDLPNGPHIEIPGAVCRKQGEHVAVKFDIDTEQRALIQKWVDLQQAS